MNNTINSVNNLTFNSRYLRLNGEIPERISDAIYKNSSIEEFINSGKPKTLWEKFVNIFKKDEFVDVYYGTRKTNANDIYERTEFVTFKYKKGTQPAYFEEKQKGMRRPAGIIRKPGEDPVFKPPMVTATEKLANAISNIKDFGRLIR